MSHLVRHTNNYWSISGKEMSKELRERFGHTAHSCDCPLCPRQRRHFFQLFKGTHSRGRLLDMKAAFEDTTMFALDAVEIFNNRYKNIDEQMEILFRNIDVRSSIGRLCVYVV